jgi:hypothetical protein
VCHSHLYYRLRDRNEQLSTANEAFFLSIVLSFGSDVNDDRKTGRVIVSFIKLGISFRPSPNRPNEHTRIVMKNYIGKCNGIVEKLAAKVGKSGRVKTTRAPSTERRVH